MLTPNLDLDRDPENQEDQSRSILCFKTDQEDQSFVSSSHSLLGFECKFIFYAAAKFCVNIAKILVAEIAAHGLILVQDAFGYLMAYFGAMRL
ncbi:hypothetical protein LOK49_LG06G01388 [Camellia lanceoleosa]|uniref:Uncharacterized protein n=1 Tax=Camellia lanceoleosa TaxID=1840588 RepID=A0ACC0HFI4_9ERIC|nr:hypothetical protein LOK49_LG06G01388 [Camellia lanceoleosa]